MRLYRDRGRPDFDPVEGAFVAAIAPAMAEGLPRSLLVPGFATRGTVEGPGVVLLDDRGRIEGVSATARRWLAEIVDVPRPAATPLPHPVYAVAARARAIHEAGDTPPGQPARARVPTRSGAWLLLHGTCLAGSKEARTAVILEPAQSPEVAPLIVRAYGLSDRERDVMQGVVRGRSTKEIAAMLGLSPYTVADHLKAIFEKVDVRSRTELVARLFFDHYYPRLLRGDPAASDGWFSGADAAMSPG